MQVSNSLTLIYYSHWIPMVTQFLDSNSNLLKYSYSIIHSYVATCIFLLLILFAANVINDYCLLCFSFFYLTMFWDHGQFRQLETSHSMPASQTVCGCIVPVPSSILSLCTIHHLFKYLGSQQFSDLQLGFWGKKDCNLWTKILGILFNLMVFPFYFSQKQMHWFY